MPRQRLKIGDLLLNAGVINEQQLQKALDYSKEQRQKGNAKRLGDCLRELGFVTDRQVAEALASQLNLQLVDLQGFTLSKQMQELIPGSTLRKHSVLPLGYDPKDPQAIFLAMSDPLDIVAIDDVEIITNCRVEQCVATQTEIQAILDRYFGSEEAMSAAEKFSKQRQERIQADREVEERAERELANAPIVQLVRTIVEQAVRSRASDIHIDALEREVRIRFRIDGVLVEKLRYDISILAALSTRIKIVSGLDIAERRRPQSGRMTATVDDVEYDIRVEILPTSFGEKIVMRLARANALTRDKSELGIQPYEMKKFDRILKHPNGIILVTGPTGSGKSTTLYTALSELNTPEVNILTVEDPVEANIPGINQVQVNPKAGLTFASALRSFLREDPDIIMVGEIRDTETAQIAVQASITGHLVVSTVHTNGSAATITRLEDMGIESYLLADSITGIIAQRLVRRLCPDCKETRYADEVEMKLLGLEGQKPRKICVPHPGGCPKCNGTGYYGRIGIYEIMEMTSHLKQIVAKSLGTKELEEEARKEGLRTLRDNAAAYVLDGMTSISEMLKVAAVETDDIVL
ncbi:MAG: Flp pilus assembly complex ATPase component TadA [Lachnospiraceae bacterium]|jgi:type IV pilus assembly protein PilB|nr:Flp pilus assembly complex ATPase component TadA [Lachnospiraceae bacterium]